MKRRNRSSGQLRAITIRIDEDLARVVHLVAGERQASFNDAIQFIVRDWWEHLPDRERYDAFLSRPPKRR